MATRSCVVIGIFCSKTALTSSSLTSPAAGDDPDSGGVDDGPLAGTQLLEVAAVSSFIGFTS